MSLNNYFNLWGSGGLFIFFLFGGGGGTGSVLLWPGQNVFSSQFSGPQFFSYLSGPEYLFLIFRPVSFH